MSTYWGFSVTFRVRLTRSRIYSCSGFRLKSPHRSRAERGAEELLRVGKLMEDGLAKLGAQLPLGSGTARGANMARLQWAAWRAQMPSFFRPRRGGDRARSGDRVRWRLRRGIRAARPRSRRGWRSALRFCPVVLAAVGLASQAPVAPPPALHPSTSISADFGSFYIVDSEVFVSSQGAIEVEQPGAASPTFPPFHDAVFEFSGGRWIPRKDHGGHASFQTPLLCDGAGQIDLSPYLDAVERSLLPPGAKVKDIRRLAGC